MILQLLHPADMDLTGAEVHTNAKLVAGLQINTQTEASCIIMSNIEYVYKVLHCL